MRVFKTESSRRGWVRENVPIPSFGTFQRDPSIFVCPGVVDSDSGNREKRHANLNKKKGVEVFHTIKETFVNTSNIPEERNRVRC
ncbi:hypothetical protein NPIL_449871 [Nephila pilipes]|uniref:Uncharacterized protein n=1 Tax=Nephila pilipes TaxID=299642 RepID=A0A8X6TQF5_NEPPI|nr:hypothetical protein NPIL_449871 [Nephila pilipes]